MSLVLLKWHNYGKYARTTCLMRSYTRSNAYISRAGSAGLGSSVPAPVLVLTRPGLPVVVPAAWARDFVIILLKSQELAAGG